MKILITAGPTREPIDPVRYLTNRSSGKMGYAIAAAAQKAGHQILLISGPTDLDIPPSVDFIPVETAAEMEQAVAQQISKMDAAIFSAAVADYTISTPSPQKIKKHGDTLNLELTKTTDILGSARTSYNFSGKLIGFAAESENLETNARLKLTKKNCDLIVANNISLPGLGFDSDQNKILLCYPEKTIELPENSKEHLATHIVEALEQLPQPLS